MNFEYSCGAVVYTRQNNTILYVIIRSLGGVYGFPKGHRKRGESEEETALREIQEETGLQVDLLPGFVFHDQHPIPNRKDRYKRITYFLGQYEDQEITPQKNELMSAELMTFEQAMDCFQYGNSKKILLKAHRFLKERYEHDQQGQQ